MFCTIPLSHREYNQESSAFLHDTCIYTVWNTNVYTSYDVTFDINKANEVTKIKSTHNVVQQFFSSFFSFISLAC
jgi:hypothetical protein